MAVRYVALKRLKVGDGYRQPGEEVPEAATWTNINAYINRSMLALVPDEGTGAVEHRAQRGRGAVEAIAPRVPLRAQRAMRDDFGTEPSDVLVHEELTEEEVRPGSDEFDYHKMNIAQVKSAVSKGLLTPEEVDAYEEERPEGRRVGIDNFLDELLEEEEDEDDFDPLEEDDEEGEE